MSMCSHGNHTLPTLYDLNLSSPSCLCWCAVGGLPADLLAEATVQVGFVVPSFHSAETSGGLQLATLSELPMCTFLDLIKKFIFGNLGDGFATILTLAILARGGMLAVIMCSLSAEAPCRCWQEQRVIRI